MGVIGQRDASDSSRAFPSAFRRSTTPRGARRLEPAPLRDAMFADWNGGASTAAAFRVTNFVLDAATRIGGIKLRTARGGTTPLARTANPLPLTQTTGRPSESMRARPSLLLPHLGGRGIAKTWKAASDREVRNDPNAR